MHPANRKFVALTHLSLAAVLTAALSLPGCGRSREQEAAATPPAVLRELESKSLYANDTARLTLLANKPELLTAEDKDAKSPRVRSFAQATQNPKLWRQLDRRYRFDAVLLMGDTASYQPLLTHLIETKDWKLSFLNQDSLLFRRPPCREWSTEDLAATKSAIRSRPASERVALLAKLADNLIATDQASLAKPCLDEALSIDGKSPRVWTSLSLYHAKLRQWNEALADTERALSVNARYQPAMAARAQLLFTTHRCEEALPLSQKLVRLSPRDPATLYLHAKIAHCAHDYTAEIDALKLLIEMAGQSGQSAAGYRLYLGQAYASISQAEPALEQFEKALADPEITKDQRAFANDSIQRIRSRVKL